jgi:hypothetical protein
MQTWLQPKAEAFVSMHPREWDTHRPFLQLLRRRRPRRWF